MKDYEYDLLIIGSGAAAMAASIEMAKEGKKVLIVEKGKIGGTCVNIGCIPSKAFIKTANHYYMKNHSIFPGIKNGKSEISWQELLINRSKIVSDLQIHKYEDVIVSNSNIKSIEGTASFDLSDNSEPIVSIDGNRKILARNYLIASGSIPEMPYYPGLKELDPITSTETLFLKEKPKSILILGGGLIAIELGQALARLGVEIKMLVRSRFLSNWDDSISDQIEMQLKNEGIEIWKGFSDLSFESTGNKKIASFKDKSGVSVQLMAEKILVATGRIANSETLNLKKVGVALDDNRGILVNGYLQTANPRIYAAGDATSLPKLVYVAAKSGKIAAKSILGEDLQLDVSILPEVIFSSPQIARVGMTEKEALEKGIQAETSFLEINKVPKSIVSNENTGFIKLIRDKVSDCLIGAHIFSENAGELIHTAYLAIEMGRKYNFTINHWKEMFFPYLTESEGLKLAIQGYTHDLKKLSCCAG